MNLLFTQETRYIECNGVLYNQRTKYPDFWNRYLDHFEKVTILARVQHVDHVPAGYLPSSGENVEYIPVPYYVGPKQFLLKRNAVKKVIKQSVENHDALLFRVPGTLGTIAADYAIKLNKIYSAEIVGDPWEVGKHVKMFAPLRFFYRHKARNDLRKIAKNAAAALYVTKYSLQNNYPSGEHTFSVGISDVFIPENSILTNTQTRFQNINKVSSNSNETIKIGNLGFLYSMKAPLLTVKAIHKCIESGLNIQMYFAGDGPLMSRVNALANELNIADNIVCLGRINTGADVINFLDSLDLYLQFSRGGEGLPRAIVEAMSRGCPVIASNVGGIPELVPEDLLVESENVNQLADKIIDLVKNPERMRQAVEENIETAKEYAASILEKRRYDFYGKVRQIFDDKYDHKKLS